MSGWVVDILECCLVGVAVVASFTVIVTMMIWLGFISAMVPS